MHQSHPPQARIIGGMFGLELRGSEASTNPGRRPAFLEGRHVLLSTARSAFTLLTHTLHPANVWLPSYLCGVVLEAFRSNQIRVRFYAVDRQFAVAEDGWLSQIQVGDMVVFIDYFGFSEWAEFGAEAVRRGAWVVEDACLALLNEHFCEHAHYVIFSPRKFVGVPEGGILQVRPQARMPDVDLSSAPSCWWLDSLRASILRREFDRHGGDRSWFESFRKTELSCPFEAYRMSELSSSILEYAVNWSMVTASRRLNYLSLARELAEIAIFPHLPDGIVPAGFPVRLRHRNSVREALFLSAIYPPIHWHLSGVAPREYVESHHLSEEELTIPCDQRYNSDDMARVVAAVKNVVSQ